MATTMKPPGVCRKHSGHGPTSPPTQQTQYGDAHLRTVLNLSLDVSTQRVCEDAARVIESMAAGETLANASAEVKAANKGPGRPPGSRSKAT